MLSSGQSHSASGPILHVGDLPSNLHHSSGERLPQNDEVLPLEELERRAILGAMREAGGDKLIAARLLGIGKTTLYRKLKQYQSYGNHPADFSPGYKRLKAALHISNSHPILCSLRNR